MKVVSICLLMMFSALLSAQENEFVEVIISDETEVQASPEALLEPDVGPLLFNLKQGLLKTNVEQLTVEFAPKYSVVWTEKTKQLQYADHQIYGASYEALLEKILMQYQLGACIRANDVVEIYNIQTNRYYCED